MTDTPTGFLSPDDREHLEEMAQATPVIRRLLDAYDVERARLTVLGEDLTGSGGGYGCAWVEERDFDGGRVYVRRTNIRQAVDAYMAYQRERWTRDHDEPWWRVIARGTDANAEHEGPGAAEHSVNTWVGPIGQTPGEVVHQEQAWADERLKEMIDDRQQYLELWRQQTGQIARLMIALGARTEDLFSDPDEFLLEHHPEKLDPRARQMLEDRRTQRQAEESEEAEPG